MQRYQNKSGTSGVTAFEIGDDYIKVRFKTNEIYTYNYSIPGSEMVEEMKVLAFKGKGLSTYISRQNPEYFSKR